MFYVENPPPEHPEPLFSLGLSVNSTIDFCTWVLERDGLQVPPFDHHPEGDHSLRESGMTAESWQRWLTKTALLLDSRMQWQVESLEAKQQRERERLLQWGEASKSIYPGLELPDFDSPALIQESDRRVAWQHQQALKLQAAVQNLYGGVTPPNLWKGDRLAAWEGTPESLVRLRELQTEYPSRQREQQWMLRPIDKTVALGEINELIIDSNRLSQLLRPYWQRLGGLELYLIAYPVPIERFISPDILILSPSLEPRSQQQFEERIVQVVDRFISSNLEC